MKTIATVLLLLLLPSPLSAQSLGYPTPEQVRFRLLLGSYLTAGFLDASTTAYCSGQGTCREVNPILSPIVEKHGVVAAMTVKGAFHAGIIGIVLAMHEERPKTATWLLVGLLGAQVAVDAANIRTLRKARR